MVGFESGACTTYADLLGTVEGSRNRDVTNPIRIYNEGVAAGLVERGIMALVSDGHYICIDEDARACFEAEIRALHYRKTPGKK